MDKIARLVASTISEGCGKNRKRMADTAKKLRGLRNKNEATEYFKGLVTAAADSVEAFLREE